MKKATKFISLILFISICFVSCDSTYDHYYSEYILDYFSDRVDFSGKVSAIFMKEIPDCAEIVDFSYYKYYNERRHIYLELKFDDQKDFENYLKSLTEHAEKYYLENIDTIKGISSAEKWIQKIQNPYDESFIELFVATAFWLSSPNYGGYFMREQYGTYHCNFSVIGYSYDELTVIQTYIHGLFSIENSPIPKYFERFEIPFNKAYDRKIEI